MLSKTGKGEMWNTISDDNFNDILEKSNNRIQLIYKHSNRCGVCFFTKGEIESIAGEIAERADTYFLEVNRQRGLSNKIASELGVRHESPQLICLEDGKVAWHFSHNSIQGERILKKFKVDQ